MTRIRKSTVKNKKEELATPPSLSSNTLQPQIPFSLETKLYCFDCRKLSVQKDMYKNKEDVYYCQKCWKQERNQAS